MSEYALSNFMTSTTDKVLVGMSGGVDSSVCVRILQDQGFEVEGLVLEFSPAHKPAVEAALAAAKKLGIPLHVQKCYEEFEKEVIEPFCREYCAGVTPSPCIRCNPAVKFKLLAAAAKEMGIEFIATGHYARVEEGDDGVYRIACAESRSRDQSYMLYRLPQEILAKLILPLGEFEKEDVRAIAMESKLPCADTPDSQEICFIPDGNYPDYISARGCIGKAGRFIGPDGQDLGEHQGVLRYTIGQRRGLNLALGKPVFVKRILENGDIQLAWAGEEFYTVLTLNDVLTADGCPLNGEYKVKIRSAAKPVSCNVNTEAGTVTVTFPEPVRAPAPGQSAVFYRSDVVMGGGIIQDMQ
ncbi:MAG: tRNA 2-thiouridine(34) synthase MnmA [Oscillospiraceae bacterium]|nr:tRNA 2-thiouridine(34) synthase MnmA [Oscillospiraceae bacterium]